MPGSVFTVLLVLVPVSAGLKDLVGASPLLAFASGALAVAVLAEWVRRATDQLADRVGPAVGGLLAVSFGSIAELVLALFGLLRGEAAVVQAQTAGSLMGTGLMACRAEAAPKRMDRSRQRRSAG